MAIDDDDDDELIEDEDAEPTYAVLLRKLQSWSFPDVSNALQVEADIPLADATRIAKKRPGILLTEVSQETAKATVKALRTLGVDCFMVPDQEIFEPPNPVHVEAMELLDDGFRAVVAGGSGYVVTTPWSEITLLALARIANTTPGGDMHLAAKRAKTGSLTQRPGVLAFAPQVRKGAFEALAIYAGFGKSQSRVLVHVDSQAFDFGCLGKARSTDWLENLLRLMGLLLERAPQALLTGGTTAARESGGRTVDTHAVLHDFHEECLWRLDLLELERKKRENGK